MKLALWTARGHVPLDEESAQIFYKCTGCMHSRSACRHDVAVDGPLREARQRAVAAAVAPQSVAALKSKYERCQSPYSVPLASQLKEQVSDLDISVKSTSSGPLAFAPSCTSIARDSEDVRAGAKILKRLHGDSVDLLAPGCCGYPLYEMGLQTEFEHQARAYLAGLHGAKKIVTNSPSCAWLVRHVYPRLGLEAPEVEPIEVELDRHRDRLKELSASRSTKSNSQVLYHDSCFMGRRLGYYEEPRRVLATVMGIWPREMDERREHSLCSGAGAGYRWTHPESSLEIAHDCLNHAPSDRKETILVSACPSARRQFRLADKQQVCSSVSALVAEKIFA